MAFPARCVIVDRSGGGEREDAGSPSPEPYALGPGCLGAGPGTARPVRRSISKGDLSVRSQANTVAARDAPLADLCESASRRAAAWMGQVHR